MTLRYAHLVASHKVEAVSFLDKALKGENLLYKNLTI